MNTGGAFGAAKDWPREHFVGLARRIVTQHDASVLVLCGPSEVENAKKIEKLARHPGIKSMAGQDLSLGVAKACIRRAHLMVTTDSGPRHFAAALGTPAVSLFGPIDPAVSVNYHPQETMLWHKVACRPCGKRVCPLIHHACMRDLTVDRVYGAVNEHLRHIAKSDAA